MALVLAVGALVSRLSVDAPLGAIVAAASASGTRAVVYRLTGLPHAPLAAPVRGDALANQGDWRVLSAAALAQEQADRTPDVAHLQALGVAALLSSRGEVAVQALEDAVTADATSAAAYSDLAAAYLARAEQSGHAIDVPRALVAADRAIRLNARLATAHFNYALALERLRLRRQAARAWDAYLVRFDDGRGWALEAREHRAALTVAPSAVAPSPAAAADARLGEWATRAIDDPEGTPQPDLASAGAFHAAIGAEIASAHGGARRQLAEIVRDMLAAEAALAVPNYGEADRLAASVLARVPAVEAPLHLWATRLRFTTGFNTGSAMDRQRAVASLAETAHRLDFTALESDAWHRLGAFDYVAGRYEQAATRYQAALRMRVALRNVRGAVSSRAALGDALHRLGREPEAWTAILDNLAAGVLGDPVLESARLTGPAASSLDAGHAAVALALARESVDVAIEAGHPGLLTQARLLEARALVRHGDAGAAARAVAESREALDRLDDASIRSRYLAEVTQAEAEVWAVAAPARALAALAESEQRFQAARASQRLIALSVLEAHAHRALGDVATARAALLKGVRLVDAQQQAIAAADLLPSYLDASWDVFSELVDLEATAGNGEAALDWLDRGFDVRRRWAGTARGSVVEASRQGPVVSYLSRPDHLWIFVLRDGVVQSRRVPVTREALARQVARLVHVLTLDDAPEAVAAAATALAREVWWPVAELLTRGGDVPPRVALVLDPLLQRVPFAMLPWTAVGEARVVDMTATVLCPSPLACRGGERASLSARVAALHAGQGGAGLAVLPAAREEAERVGRRYAGAEVAVATEAAFARAITTADVVHFSGHAVPDERYPGRSELLLASDVGDGVRVPLDRLLGGGARARLVVLSACRTSRAEARRGEGGVGVAGEFLRAGVAQVVATQWDVRDDVAGVAMDLVHDALAAGVPPWDAVRAAQLRLQRDPARRLRDWAGYVAYTSVSSVTESR